MVFAIPGIDEQKMLDIYEGDFDIYLPVLRAYVSEMPVSLQHLRNVSAETLPEYVRRMHSIKGTSASVCAEEARKTAVQLETMAKAGDLSGVLARNESFLRYMGGLISGIQEWLHKNGK